MFVYNKENNTMETERLLLRRFTLEDAPRVAEICNTEEVYRGTLALPHPYTVESAVWWIEQQDGYFATDHYYDYAITDKRTGELYGCMGMGPDMASKMGELGYWIDPAHWNKGIATEAAQAMIRYAFDELNFHKVNATYFTYNPASGRVMEKAGMEKEGLRRKHIWKIDRFEDVAIYGIVNPADE